MVQIKNKNKPKLVCRNFLNVFYHLFYPGIFLLLLSLYFLLNRSRFYSVKMAVEFVFMTPGKRNKRKFKFELVLKNDVFKFDFFRIHSLAISRQHENGAI